MSEENQNKPDVDITQAAEDLANEKLEENQKKEQSKVSELEAKLAEYQKKEEEQRLAEEEARKSELDKRVQELEKQRLEDQKAWEEKLEKLSTRQSSGKVADPKKALTREEYEANKSEYDRMLAQHILKNGTL